MPFFATEDNTKLYYEEYGEGKTVVFVPGWDCSHHHFRRQIPEFRKNFHVLAYDLRGHGDSDRTEYGLTLPQLAKDLHDLIEFTGVRDVTLVGWSMGVDIIWEYVRHYGEEYLSRLVFIDQSPKMLTDDTWSWGFTGSYSLEASAQFLVDIATDWNAATEGFVPALFATEGFTNENGDFEWALEQARKNTPHVMINLWLAITLADYRDVLDTITIPTLITYGKYSAMYSVEAQQYVHEHIANSTLQEFTGGHALHIEDYEHFNSVVKEFIG